MRRPGRSNIGLILVVIYSLIIMGPLASRVMDSTTAVVVAAAECTGDCRTCGCSAASMATGSCCCMKKQQQIHAHEDGHDGTADCDQRPPDKKQTAIASCGCRSGNGDHAVLSGNDSSELLPCCFTVQFSIPGTDTRFPPATGRVTSFQGEPPDPPPKISFRS